MQMQLEIFPADTANFAFEVNEKLRADPKMIKNCHHVFDTQRKVLSCKDFCCSGGQSSVCTKTCCCCTSPDSMDQGKENDARILAQRKPKLNARRGVQSNLEVQPIIISVCNCQVFAHKVAHQRISGCSKLMRKHHLSSGSGSDVFNFSLGP